MAFNTAANITAFVNTVYEGALLVISHDEVFLENIGIEEVHFLKRGPPTTKT